MKWTVLVDNRTNNPILQTEHGLSILLETDNHCILLDVGASDMLVRNAEKLGIDLRRVDFVFISHGHSDHVGGLKHFMAINEHAKIIVSPYAMNNRFYSKRLSVHSITAEWPMIPNDRLLAISQSGEVADGLYAIAKIQHTYPMPKGNKHLLVQASGYEFIQDDFRHELALYTEGILFTGCAHNGLKNILSACPHPVRTVLGGFHLLDHHETFDELRNLAVLLLKQYPETLFYTSHCTGDNVFTVLHDVMTGHLHAFACGTTVET